jgi:NitT/TauT family transport system permease protein
MRRAALIGKPLPTSQRIGLGFIGIVVVLLVWQLTATFKLANPILVSSPIKVVKTGFELTNSGVLGTAVASTGKLFLISISISIVSGVLIGAVIGWYRMINGLMDPLVSIAYATPRIALIPLITVWFGIGFEARVLIVWMLAVFPIIINVASGVGSIDRDLVEVSRSFLGKSTDILRHVAIPGAVPAIVSGIRQGILLGLIGVVVAEYFVGDTGVGGLIFNAGLVLNTGIVYLGALVFAGTALVLTMLLKMVERRVDKWRV